jgi:hypothetical protein
MTDPDAPTTKFRRFVFPALLVVLVLLLFRDVISHGFNSDDYLVVYHALYQSPQDVKVALTSFAEPTWGLYYRPLIKMFFEMLARLFGAWPRGYHAVSIGSYAVLCLQVYFLTQLLCRQTSIAVSSTLVFMAASVHSEALFWISSLNGVVENVLSLAALICFIQWKKTASRQYYWLALFLFVCALFTKESAISLPIVLAAYDFLLVNRPTGMRALKNTVRSCWSFALAGALFVMLRALVMRQADLPPPLTSFGPRAMFDGICYSLIMTLSPIDWALSLHWFDEFNKAGTVFFLISIILLLACAILPLLLGRLRLAFLLAWIVAGSAPVLALGLVPSERHVVFSSAGAAILVGLALSKPAKRLHRTGAAPAIVAVALAVLFSSASLYFLKQRQTIWKTASKTAAHLISQTITAFPAPPNTTFFYLNVPDTMDGAFVFRFENLEYGLKLAYGNDSIEVVRVVSLDRIPPNALATSQSAYFNIAAKGGNIFVPKESLNEELTARWEQIKAYGILDKNPRYSNEWKRYEASPFFSYTGEGLLLMPPYRLRFILDELYSLV